MVFQEEVDLDKLPVGSILPFKPEEVPSGWLSLKGQTLHWSSYPTLHERLIDVMDIWKVLGGKVDSDSFTLPSLESDEEANAWAWGRLMRSFAPIPMEIAIKARR